MSFLGGILPIPHVDLPCSANVDIMELGTANEDSITLVQVQSSKGLTSRKSIRPSDQAVACSTVTVVALFHSYRPWPSLRTSSKTRNKFRLGTLNHLHLTPTSDVGFAGGQPLWCVRPTGRHGFSVDTGTYPEVHLHHRWDLRTYER